MRFGKPLSSKSVVTVTYLKPAGRVAGPAGRWPAAIGTNHNAARTATTTTSWRTSIDGFSLRQHHRRLFEQLAERGQKLGGGGAVDGAVVGAEGERHHGAGDDLVAPFPLPHHRAFFRPADGEDADLRRVDDRGELAHAEHAQVAHGERRAAQFILLE